MTVSQSIGQRLDQTKGFGPGFDFMRVFLAIGVLITHACNLLVFNAVTVNGLEYSNFWFLEISILPMFFALSGFLVTASAMRLTLPGFLLHRGARIFPALITEITLSALILGPLLTSYSLYTYFSDSRFFIYFLNILGFIHYNLPGLFIHRPVAMYQGVVNRSLWTIPHELFCYLSISIAIYTGAFLFRKRALWYFGTFAILYFSLSFLRFAPLSPFVRESILAIGDQARALLPYFILGCAAYLLRYKIPFDIRLFGICILIFLLFSFLGNAGMAMKFGMRPLTSFLFTYTIIYLGLCPLPRLPFYSRGDYSYGIYLYGFPIQQTILNLFPNMTSLWVFIPSSIAAATAFAVFSWHVIEKPALKIRKSFSLTMRQHQKEKTKLTEPPKSNTISVEG